MPTDNSYNVIINKGHSPVNDLFVKLLKEKLDGRHFLDVGCNVGYLIMECGYNGVGCDLSMQMVSMANNNGVIAIWGDATSLPFADGRFPVVVLSCILEQIELPLSAVDEALRVCEECVIGITPIPNASQWGKIGENKWVKSVTSPERLKKKYKAIIEGINNTHYLFVIEKAKNEAIR